MPNLESRRVREQVAHCVVTDAEQDSDRRVEDRYRDPRRPRRPATPSPSQEDHSL